MRSPLLPALTRRSFLGHTAAAGAVMISAQALCGQEAPGAGDRLSIGVIGCGDRASALMSELQQQSAAHNARITALCDVWQVNLKRAAGRVKKWWGKEPRTFTRFSDLLALPDIDAVIIATPDFGHCPILVAALEAGKDAYVEKPMAMDLEDANRALDLARSGSRVVQVGTQRRSDGLYRAVAARLQSGVLGAISRVTIENNFNEPRWARDYSNCNAADVDWEAYLFNREKRPFDPRLLRRWQLYRMCTNGMSGLWMSHFSDVVNMLLGTTYPASAVAMGGTYVWKEDREHNDTFHALLDYPQGFLMSWAMGLGNSAGMAFTVHGTKGTCDVNTALLTPKGGSKSELKEETIAAGPGESHMGNWLACLRSRQLPNADIQYGHQHAAATIMAAAALETGLRHKYDVEKRQIVAG